ncbi:hypothetical protein A2U01_0020282, partial [Trifolium medium]|nr:hypothetical protein [Trifolium medium]
AEYIAAGSSCTTRNQLSFYFIHALKRSKFIKPSLIALVLSKVHRHSKTLNFHQIIMSSSSQIKSTTTPQKTKTTRTSSKETTPVMVTDAKPITIIPASASTKKTTKSKSVVKKEKLKVMSGDPFRTGNVKSHVDASVKETIVSNFESSDKVSKQIEKSKVEKVAAETIISQNPKSDETLYESRPIDETIADTVQPSVPVNDQMDMSEKVSTGPVAESVKENTTTPDVAQDVGASSVQPNPNAATITESLGDGSNSEAATEEEVEQEDVAKEKSVDVVEDSQSEESVEKTVSLGE